MNVVPCFWPGALGVDGPAVELDEMAHDDEPDPETFLRLAAAVRHRAGVKIREICPASIPLPVSRTLTSTSGPLRSRRYLDALRANDFGCLWVSSGAFSWVILGEV